MGSPKKRIQYRYDSVGNRVGMTDPDGGRFTYAYDAVNRIKEVVNPQGDRTSYAYDAGGRRTVKKLANGTRASFSYDSASNLTRLANLKSDGTTISSFNYEYDRVGNRTAVLEADGSRVTWSYDDTYQLTGEHRSGTTPYEDSYTYDASGNRLLKIHDGARTTYSYDAANQLEWSEDASGRTTYTFDADGNQQLVVEPTGDRTTTSWDYENRTTLVQLPSGIRNTMAYEPAGLRVKLEESTGTKKFVWDDQNYLAETDEDDDTQVVYTNEPRLYGNLVSQRRGTDSHWYHFDAIGSTRELTDSGETVTDTRLYDAWGLVLQSTGAVPLVFAYHGRFGAYRNPDSIDLYVRARYYSPNSGRWSSVDPQIEWASLLVGGLYVFADNRVVGYVDPSGLQREEDEEFPFPEGEEQWWLTYGGGPTKLDNCVPDYEWEIVQHFKVPKRPRFWEGIRPMQTWQLNVSTTSDVYVVKDGECFKVSVEDTTLMDVKRFPSHPSSTHWLATLDDILSLDEIAGLDGAVICKFTQKVNKQLGFDDGQRGRGLRLGTHTPTEEELNRLANMRPPFLVMDTTYVFSNPCGDCIACFPDADPCGLVCEETFEATVSRGSTDEELADKKSIGPWSGQKACP